MFWVQVRGEEMEAELIASPAPARSPPRVVEAVPPTATSMVDEAVIGPVPPPRSTLPEVKLVAPVPPTFTVRVEEEVIGEFPLPMRGWPEVVLVAVRLPEVRVPEMRALPWTESVWDGEVVPKPSLPNESMITIVEVEKAEGVGDSIAKRGSLVAVEVAETESLEKGELVPMAR